LVQICCEVKNQVASRPATADSLKMRKRSAWAESERDKSERSGGVDRAAGRCDVLINIVESIEIDGFR